MNAIKRIFVVGYPGAGKDFFARELAKKLGWKFIDENFDLEIKIGKSIYEILGDDGVKKFNIMQSNVLSSLKDLENIVVTTDASIASSEDILKILSSEFVVYLKASTETQLSRMARNQPPFLISDLKEFVKKLHHDRDAAYEKSATFSIDTNDSDLDKHVLKTIKIVHQKNDYFEQNPVEDILVIFHKTTHKPIELNKKQSECLILLASGKSSKEIANIMHLSSRTIEDHINKLMEILGCSSSKELIALYYDQP
ncbi:MAG: hypothetical protein ACD_46C00418G0001 [uncultured bacterium]|nr:MAG: hypothetical protein ACD_46C00418G0001 [uncultured bacterium]